MRNCCGGSSSVSIGPLRPCPEGATYTVAGAGVGAWQKGRSVKRFFGFVLVAGTTVADNSL